MTIYCPQNSGGMKNCYIEGRISKIKIYAVNGWDDIEINYSGASGTEGGTMHCGQNYGTTCDIATDKWICEHDECEPEVAGDPTIVRYEPEVAGDPTIVRYEREVGDPTTVPTRQSNPEMLVSNNPAGMVIGLGCGAACCGLCSVTFFCYFCTKKQKKVVKGNGKSSSIELPEKSKDESFHNQRAVISDIIIGEIMDKQEDSNEEMYQNPYTPESVHTTKKSHRIGESHGQILDTEGK